MCFHDSRSTSASRAHVSDSRRDGLAVVGVGNGNTLTALAAVVLSRVDGYNVGGVAIYFTASTGVTTLA